MGSLGRQVGRAVLVAAVLGERPGIVEPLEDRADENGARFGAAVGALDKPAEIASQPARQRVTFRVIDAVEAIEQRSACCGERGEKLGDGASSRSGSRAAIDPHQRLVPDGQRSPAIAGPRAGATRELRQEIGQPHEAQGRAPIERRAGADDRLQRVGLLEARDVLQELGAELRAASQSTPDVSRATCREERLDRATK